MSAIFMKCECGAVFITGMVGMTPWPPHHCEDGVARKAVSYTPDLPSMYAPGCAPKDRPPTMYAGAVAAHGRPCTFCGADIDMEWGVIGTPFGAFHLLGCYASWRRTLRGRLLVARKRLKLALRAYWRSRWVW
jgi:hypothetical protein